MAALKIVFLVIAIVSVPVLTFFLIRLVVKMARGVDHINRTLGDARPQMNMLLSNLNQTLEDVNNELDRVEQLTEDTQGMVLRLEGSLKLVEDALRSPAARYGGMIAAFLTTTFLIRGILRRNGGRDAKAKRRRRRG